MFLVRKIMLLIIVILGGSIHGFSQNQSNLLDIRTCDKSCSSNNYTIESVYLSDSTGTPVTSSLLTCSPGTEQTTYISFTYTTSATSTANNGRLFADLLVGDSTLFLNYYFGTIPSAKTVADTLTLAEFPLTWTCGEVVILQNPLLAWTTSASADLSGAYVCNDYPTAQCQTTATIVVDAPLAVQFDYSASCLVDERSEVTFTSTTNGGREAYQYDWTFTNATISSDTVANPLVQFLSSGTAELTVTDANGTQNSFSSVIDIPVTTNLNAAITDHTDDENPDGAIAVTMVSTGDYSYSWTGPGGFTSSQQSISELIGGDYHLSVTDGFGCSSHWDFEVDYFGALPITWGEVKASVHADPSVVSIKWSTLKERESSHYEIQRAIQDLSSFTTLGKIPGQGNTDQTTQYQYTDKLQPGTGTWAYYRICQFNRDGSFEYSPTLSVAIPTVEGQTSDWTAYPNPTNNGSLYLIFTGTDLPSDQFIRIKIIEQETSVQLASEWNGSPIELSQWIQLLPKGLLILEIHYADKVQRLKVIQR